MDLAEYQRAFARICFSAEPDAADVAAIGGDTDRWLMYRRMVRKRLRRVTKEGIPRTAEVLGETYDTTHGEFLAKSGVHSRYIRDAIPEFCSFLLERSDDRRVRDVCRYELAMWIVRDLEDGPPSEGLVEFDFELPLAVNPAHQMLWVRHPVWDRERFAAGELLGHEQGVAVLRTSEERTASITLPRWYFSLLAASADGQAVTSIVQSMAGAGEITLDAGFVNKLVDLTTAAIERGLVLGSVSP
ncbi:MAG: hypothetical protein ACJAYU_003023 [Bradymonadia bacterium]|jgi:hypothetical protein